MKVVILCGGKGTRIRDVADDIPKPMLPIGGKPIVWHIMKGFAQHGFTDFVLCLGYKSWIIKNYFLDYHLADVDFSLSLGSSPQIRLHGASAEQSWNITLAETGLESMTGFRVKCIEKYIQDDDFMLTYGDGVADVNIRELLAFHQSHGRTGTVTAVQPPSRFGELKIEGASVVDFAEKPVLANNRISAGFFVFRRQMFDRLERDPTLILEQAPLMGLARDGQLMAYEHQGFWHPMDSSRDFNLLNELWNKGEAPWKTWESSEAARLRIAA